MAQVKCRTRPPWSSTSPSMPQIRTATLTPSPQSPPPFLPQIYSLYERTDCSNRDSLPDCQTARFSAEHTLAIAFQSCTLTAVMRCFHCTPGLRQSRTGGNPESPGSTLRLAAHRTFRGSWWPGGRRASPGCPTAPAPPPPLAALTQPLLGCSQLLANGRAVHLVPTALGAGRAAQLQQEAWDRRGC